MAGFFACGGVAAGLVGLLFGLGLLLAPASAVSRPPGDTLDVWLWAIPAGGLLLSLAALVQAVKGRPVLLPRDWTSERLFLFSRRSDAVCGLLLLGVITVAAIAAMGFEVLFMQGGMGPELRAASWERVTVVLGMVTLPLVLFSITAFQFWWRQRGPSSVLSRTCGHCGYSLVGVGLTWRCPECGGGVNGA